MRVILTGGSGLIGSHNADRTVDVCDTVTRLYYRSTEKRGDSSDCWQLERLAFANWHETYVLLIVYERHVQRPGGRT